MHKGFYVGLNVLIFSSIGGWLGEVVGGGSFLGIPSLIGASIGIFVGYWLGYKMADYLGG